MNWRVEGTVVTHDPDLDRLAAVLDAATAQVRHLTVVDNGSADMIGLRSLLAGYRSVDLIELNENRGIAAALNVALISVQDGHETDWLLTLDQDTVIHDRAVSEILRLYADLDPELQVSCAILAMNHIDASSMSGPWKWVDRRNTVTHINDALREVRAVITSGNLLRVRAVAGLQFEEALFMDQVDTAWSALVRRQGWRIFESQQVLMDHRLGTGLTIRGKSRRYWSRQRLYYIVRNSSLLLCRGDISFAEYMLQLTSHFRTHIWNDGLSIIPRCMAIILMALFDACTGRMGRREYSFTKHAGQRNA